MSYAAPLKDMQFALSSVCDLDGILAFPAFSDAAPDLLDHVFTEAARIAAEVYAPLNRAGDQHGAVLDNGTVRTAPGFKDAYTVYAEGGWNGVSFPPEHGGMGLPWTVSQVVQEMWQSANMALALGPLLTQSTVEALLAHGTDEQRATYLPKLVSGEWMGTMNLTEPQAGSDLAQINARAVPDGSRYRLHGQKIFISYGDHDLSENIIHMVLARIPGAPPGTAGISMFLVPKVLPGNAGGPGSRNDIRCASLEHKLGIHASPTAVMSYGDNDGAIGFLVGEQNKGLACMFTMMNTARLGVGLQGLAVAERAYQQAVGYARDRTQSRALSGNTNNPVTIINHPGVRRQLMLMRSQIEAMRALNYYAAAQIDVANHHPDAAPRAAASARAGLLTPIAKAWSTDVGAEIASLGIQVHGGMGYIEETGAAQHLRDVRVTSIYEGTNGIQANDLLGRKVLHDNGKTLSALLDEMSAFVTAGPPPATAAIHAALSASIAHLRQTTAALAAQADTDIDAAFAGAEPYLRLAAITVAGWLLARGAEASAVAIEKAAGDTPFHHAKLATAAFFAAHVMSATPGLASDAASGGTVMAFDLDQF